MIFKMKIREPWWGAWSKFDWPHGTWGVGLKKDEVDMAAKTAESILRVQVVRFKKEYDIDPRKVQEYAQTNDTHHIAKGVKLYVVPHTLLEGKE